MCSIEFFHKQHVVNTEPVEQLMSKHQKNDVLFRSGDPDFMTSLARGLEVLQSFSYADGFLSMTEISLRTGLSRAVVRRCLYTLQELGYVMADDGKYRASPKVISLGHSCFPIEQLSIISRPVLQRISEQTHESSAIAVLDFPDVVCIAGSHKARVMSVTVNVGSRLPAYCTSLGRAIMAYLPGEEVENYLSRIDFVRHTPKTVKNKTELKTLLREVHEKGYSIVDHELELGLRSISVPVLDFKGEAIAAITIAANETRVSKDKLIYEFLPVLRQASEQLGMQTSG